VLLSSVRRGTSRAGLLASVAGGLVAGGCVTATALWLFSGFGRALPVAGRVVGLLVVAIAAASRDAGIDIRLPETQRQIASGVFDRGSHRGLALFGLQLGTGVLTYTSAGAPYVAAAGLLLAGPSYVGALLVGVGFGLGRLLVPVSQSLGPVDLEQWNARWSATPWMLPLLLLLELVGWLWIAAR